MAGALGEFVSPDTGDHPARAWRAWCRVAVLSGPTAEAQEARRRTSVVPATRERSRARSTSRSEPATVRPGASGIGTTLGTATTWQPAAVALAVPFGESSSATQRRGSAPRSRAAVRYGSGSGLVRVTSSPRDRDGEPVAADPVQGVLHQVAVGGGHQGRGDARPRVPRRAAPWRRASSGRSPAAGRPCRRAACGRSPRAARPGPSGRACRRPCGRSSRRPATPGARAPTCRRARPRSRPRSRTRDVRSPRAARPCRTGPPQAPATPPR